MDIIFKSIVISYFKTLRHIKNIIRILISPVWLLDQKMNESTQSLLINRINNNSQWLDVGCGLKPHLSCFKNAQYTGIDVEVSGRSPGMKVPDKYFDGINIPFEDNKFDGILCTQVLEHVEHLELLLQECSRVLKMGGIIIVSVPFVYREHEQPYDFRRFTSFGLTLSLNRSGFDISQCLKCLSAIETIATLFCVYVSNNFSNKNKLNSFLIGVLFTSPVLFISKYLAKILPDNKDLYCVLISSAVKTPLTKARGKCEKINK